MFDEMKRSIDEAIELINEGKYKESRSTMAYAKFVLGKIEKIILDKGINIEENKPCGCKPTEYCVICFPIK